MTYEEQLLRQEIDDQERQIKALSKTNIIYSCIIFLLVFFFIGTLYCMHSMGDRIEELSDDVAYYQEKYENG